MNLSDIIAKCQKVLEQHGDLAVFVGESIVSDVFLMMDEKDDPAFVEISIDEDEGMELH